MSEASSDETCASVAHPPPPVWREPGRYYGFNAPSSITLGSTAHDVTRLYIMQLGDLVKVGLARDVQARLNTFQLGCPVGLQLRASRKVPLAFARQVELGTHAALADVAHGREWFRTTPEVALAAALPLVQRSWRANRKLVADGFRLLLS